MDAAQFIDQNKEKYMTFLTTLPGFPSVCDYASDILGAYLHVHFGESDAYMTGYLLEEEIPEAELEEIDDFDDLGECHSWGFLNSNIIVDFTACQFFGVNRSMIQPADSDAYNKYTVKYNLSVLLTDTHPERLKYITYGPTSIDESLIKCARENSSFDDYLKSITPYLTQEGLLPALDSVKA